MKIVLLVGAGVDLFYGFTVTDSRLFTQGVRLPKEITV